MPPQYHRKGSRIPQHLFLSFFCEFVKAEESSSKEAKKEKYRISRFLLSTNAMSSFLMIFYSILSFEGANFLLDVKKMDIFVKKSLVVHV
jgi:hypothetical protein